MRASSEHDREWEEEKVRDEWAKKVHKAADVAEFMPLIDQLDAGMCQPSSLCARKGQNGEPDKIQRMKLQLFKFWPSQELKSAWKFYMEQEGVPQEGSPNLNSLFIALKIMEKACEQFSVRQA